MIRSTLELISAFEASNAEDSKFISFFEEHMP